MHTSSKTLTHLNLGSIYLCVWFSLVFCFWSWHVGCNIRLSGPRKHTHASTHLDKMWLRHPDLKPFLTSNESTHTYCIPHRRWCFSFGTTTWLALRFYSQHASWPARPFISSSNQHSLPTFDPSAGRLLLFQLLSYYLSNTILNTLKRAWLCYYFMSMIAIQYLYFLHISTSVTLFKMHLKHIITSSEQLIFYGSSDYKRLLSCGSNITQPNICFLLTCSFFF